jgi:uncharacterized Ntn-hydrolase superfamily protein
MTFAIAARCAETGMFGVAVSSSSPCVAARCAHARAGVGAVTSQNITDPSLGARLLDLMAQGASAAEAVAIVRRTAPHIEFRQLMAVDAGGGTAAFSGDQALGVYAAHEGEGCVAAGNLLASTAIPAAMTAAFADASGHLGDRLIAAMQAGLAAGGEAGPVRSSGMTLVRDVSWPVADLRVDWTEECPIAALAALWDVYKPQLDDYVTRALDPSTAPSYGVPGDA